MKPTRGSVDTAIILAGGLGTRLRSAVPDLPKPMAPVNGRPFLEHQIDYWIKQGISHFMISVGYRRELIISHFGSDYKGARIDYAIEEKPLGTGGGLLEASRRLNGQGAFLLLNGDTFFEVSLDELSGFHNQSNSDWTFSLFRTDENGRYMGLEINDAGKILSFSTDTGTRDRLANGGVYLIETAVLERFASPANHPYSLEDDIIPALFSNGRHFYGQVCHGRFIDIGIPQDYYRAAEILTA